MKKMLSGFFVLYFEIKANRLRPAIIQYLHSQKTYWQQTLEKFRNNDKIVTLVINNEDEILNNIKDIELELDFDNKYQLLKLRYRNDKETLLSIAADYCAFWACLDFFRKTTNLNAADPFYAKTASEFGHKKQQIYTKFNSLLGV